MSIGPANCGRPCMRCGDGLQPPTHCIETAQDRGSSYTVLPRRWDRIGRNLYSATYRSLVRGEDPGPISSPGSFGTWVCGPRDAASRWAVPPRAQQLILGHEDDAQADAGRPDRTTGNRPPAAAASGWPESEARSEGEYPEPTSQRQ